MLDPQVEAVLAATRDAPPPQTVEEARAQYAQSALRFAGEREEVAVVRTEPGPPSTRIYEPVGWVGTVLWIHGGGWIMGTLDAYDALCRALAVRAGARVVAVDYRLAPEHPFPAALEDCAAALDAIAGADAGPVAVAGDSAGGNLAAVLARRGRARLAFQLLVYPVTDAAMATASYARFGADEAFGLSRASMAACWAAYAPHPAGRSPDASPLRAGDLAGVPPAFVVLAECDPLTDEGLDYAERLRAAGVPVETRVWPGMAHGFVRWRAAVDAARGALDEAAVAVRAALRP